MGRIPRRVKWYWFFSLEPTAAVLGGVFIATVFLSDRRLARTVADYASLAYVAEVIMWCFFVVYGKGKIVPPLYFRCFWIGVAVIVLIALTLLQRLSL